MEQQNLMGNGMAPQNMMMMMNRMQQPQSGNEAQQIHARIMEDLRQKQPTIPLGGWQTTFDPGQRATRIMQLVSALRMLHQETMKCLSIAENFEERTFLDSPNKEIYSEKMTAKMGEIHQRRMQNAPGLRNNQMGMQMNNNNNMGMQQNGMGNMNNMQNLGLGNGMNMNNMGNNMGMNMNMNMGNNGMMGIQNQMGMNNGQQNPNFPAQLQRQMQPSPLPQQNQQQNNTLDPSALQNSQVQQQMMQQQMMSQGMPQQTPRTKPPNANMQIQGQGGIQVTKEEVVAHARRIYDSMPDQQKDQMRAQLLNKMPEQNRAAYVKQDGDPVFKALLGKSRDAVLRQRQAAMNQQAGGQNGAGMQLGNNAGMNPNNGQQTPASQGNAQTFDFSSIMGQQQNAIKSQESGEQVVPASNNNMGLGGQMNMPQGVNPQQLLANQNNQGGNNNNNSQMQMLVMQQRMQQEKQRQMAMQGQMNQPQGTGQQGQNQNQLRGQPGGLNAPNALNGGQVNSPAMNMNMLNRPMAPPGQTTPSTPQPNRSQGMPQTPANPVNQLAQHHQSMVNQNNAQMNQGGQGAQQQQLPLASFPQNVRERLQSLPPHQQMQVLQKIRENPQNYSAMLNALQQSGSLGMLQQQPGAGGPQMGNQAQMMPGMPQNMNTAVPAFNSQPPPNQEQGQQTGNNGQLSHQQKMAQQQQMMIRQRAMDLGEFAKPVPQNLGIVLPPEARTWGDIKRYLQHQNSQGNVPPNLMEKLHGFQVQWYTAHPEELKQNVQQLQQMIRNGQQQGMQAQQQGQPQMPPSARPPSAQPGPNGQAPPAQMVPPNPQMAQQPNQNGMPANFSQIKPITMDEIVQFRSRIPNSANLTDDQIRNVMMRKKQQTWLAQQQHQKAQMEQQNNMRRAQTIANGGQAPAPNMQQPQQSQPPQQPQPPNQQMNMQGQKRQQSSSDDVMEIPNPNQPQVNNAQRTGVQANQLNIPGLPPGLKMPTSKAELEKMEPQHRLLVIQKMKQMDALRKAQGGLNNNQGAAAAAPQQQQNQPAQPPNVAQKQPGPPQVMPQGSSPAELQVLDSKIKALWDEVQRTTPKGPPITLDSEGLEQVQTSLKRLWMAVSNLDRTFYPALRAPQLGAEKVKEAMRAKIIVQQNAKDKDGNTKDYLSVKPEEIKRLELFVGQYFTALKHMKAKQDAYRAALQGGAQVQQPPAQQAAQTEKPQPPATLERKPSQQSQARKQSNANKAPPAPTDNTKTFDWGAQSPQGVPKYEPTRSELTQEKLKLPPNKKRRTAGQPESTESTPAAATSTPQANGASPSVAGAKAQAEQAKKMQAQPKVEAPKYRCDDPMCEASVRGFETQELLTKHKDSLHKPVEDPLQFLQDALDRAEKTMQAEKPPAVVSKPPAKPRLGVAKTEGQTPDIKTEVVTPRPGSSVGKPGAKGTPASGKKAADSRAPDSAIEVPEKEKTLLESMAAKISFDLPTMPAPPSSPPRADDVFQDLLANMQTADASLLFGANDWTDFSTADMGFEDATWSLRPEQPESSPSEGSSAGQSSRESDISQSERLRINFEWDAFGNGDTGVPEGLMQTLGLGSEGQDAEMTGVGKDGQWNWSTDLDSWDAVFGARAGLDEVGMVF